MNDSRSETLKRQPMGFDSSLDMFQFLVKPVPAKNGGAAAEWRKNRFEWALTAAEVGLDLVTVASAVVAAYLLYDALGLGSQLEYRWSGLSVAAASFAIVFVLLMDRAGAYRQSNSLLRVKETERILRVTLQSFLLVFAVTFLTSFLFSRWVLALAFFLVPLLLLAQKSLVYMVLHSLHARGYWVRRVLIYGAGFTGRRIFSALARSPKLGLNPVVFVDDDPACAGTTIYESSYQRRRSLSVRPGPLTAEMIRRYRADMVILAIPANSREHFKSVLDQVGAAGAQVAFVPSYVAPSDYWIEYVDIDGILLVSTDPRRRDAYESFKRVFDLGIAATLLAALAPVFLLIMALIRIGSAGPAIFKQTRVGKHGRAFKLYKFRTMYIDTPRYAVSPEATTDPRVTPMGWFLRRTSLDELPQLLNVLKGEMSLVGPRPEMPFIVRQYGQREQQRLLVKPGITGLWQISADRAYQIHENLEYDLYYIRNRNFFMDMAILLHTAVFAARGI